METTRPTIVFCLALFSVPAIAQVQFTAVGAQRGILPFVMDHGMGGGIAAADFDDDGDVDLFVPNAVGVPDQLYRNLGDGHFEEIAAAAGLASTDHSRAALWVDYDGDHRLDLFVAADCFEAALSCALVTPLRLYRQVADAHFVEVTGEAGLAALPATEIQHFGGMSAGDLDGDGDLDLLTGVWKGTVQLYRNEGDGTFTEVSGASGMSMVDTHFQPVMYDFNQDGWLDIFHAIDFDPNRLWLNQHDFSFVDVAPQAGVDNSWNDMGVTLGDIDNDGDLDIYITNIEGRGVGTVNLLLRNDSTPAALNFTRILDAGVEHGGWGWGTTFFDADNDGDVDLAATNGWMEGESWVYDASKLFRNDGGDPVVFSDISDSAGFNDTDWGSSLIAFDHDRDGDLDLVQVCNGRPPHIPLLRVLDNESSPGNHYLVIKPRMQGANHRAIGAVVRLEIGELRLMRLITAGISFLGQEPAEAFFGLGTATRVDRVIVEWPDGRESVLGGVAADRQLTVNAATLFSDGFEAGSLVAW